MSIYTLVIGKTGSKPKEAAPKATADRSTDDSMLDRSYVIAGDDRATIRAVSEPIAYLTNQLSNFVELPVTDGTGLTGRYSFQISWTPVASIDAPSDARVWGSVFSALQAELGLKLDRRKGLLDVLVVDNLAKVPKDN